jgi:hypothetical protein
MKKIEPTEIRIDGGYLVFKFANGHEYDPSLKSTKDPLWLDQMRDKDWFTEEVEQQTLSRLKAHRELINF